MSRLDKDREINLTPQRFDYAIKKLNALGIAIETRDSKKIQFQHKGATVTLYPFSGWFTGKTVHDGRGADNLIDQIKKA